VLLTGLPEDLFLCLDQLHDGELFAFRPETVTRFAVQQIRSPQSVEICLSTQPLNDLGDPRCMEIGRVGVLIDDRLMGGQNCVLLVLHDAQIKDRATHCCIADMALHITRGQLGDMVFAPVRDIMEPSPTGARRSRVSLYTTTDGGTSWQIKDLSNRIDDFLVPGDDSVIVRTGFRIARMSVGELCEALQFNEPVVANDQGYLVDPNIVLVHFQPSDSAPPLAAYYDTFTGLTTVLDSTGRERCYEPPDGCLVINWRHPASDMMPYMSIQQSGDRVVSAPMARIDVRNIEV
jgi:hypothetical protein